MKANVVMRRIRAYRRRVAELTKSKSAAHPGGDLDKALAKEIGRYGVLLGAADGAMANFLSGRRKGPWAKAAAVSP